MISPTVLISFIKRLWFPRRKPKVNKQAVTDWWKKIAPNGYYQLSPTETFAMKRYVRESCRLANFGSVKFAGYNGKAIRKANRRRRKKRGY